MVNKLIVLIVAMFIVPVSFALDDFDLVDNNKIYVNNPDTTFDDARDWMFKNAPHCYLENGTVDELTRNYTRSFNMVCGHVINVSLSTVYWKDVTLIYHQYVDPNWDRVYMPDIGMTNQSNFNCFGCTIETYSPYSGGTNINFAQIINFNNDSEVGGIGIGNIHPDETRGVTGNKSIDINSTVTLNWSTFKTISVWYNYSENVVFNNTRVPGFAKERGYCYLYNGTLSRTFWHNSGAYGGSAYMPYGGLLGTLAWIEDSDSLTSVTEGQNPYGGFYWKTMSDTHIDHRENGQCFGVIQSSMGGTFSDSRFECGADYFIFGFFAASTVILIDSELDQPTSGGFLAGMAVNLSNTINNNFTDGITTEDIVGQYNCTDASGFRYEGQDYLMSEVMVLDETFNGAELNPRRPVHCRFSNTTPDGYFSINASYSALERSCGILPLVPYPTEMIWNANSMISIYLPD